MGLGVFFNPTPCNLGYRAKIIAPTLTIMDLTMAHFSCFIRYGSCVLNSFVVGLFPLRFETLLPFL
ncbi:hypothetical protein BGL79_01535 [Helicobacter pylori]|nr:hypothetical protein BGL79_01535 [Helicobacter pylori]